MIGRLAVGDPEVNEGEEPRQGSCGLLSTWASMTELHAEEGGRQAGP